MEQEWTRNISNKPKLRKYIPIEDNFALPDYVSTLIPKPHRNIFAQLHGGILPLREEIGRRQRVGDDTTGHTRSLKLQEGVCSICSSGEVIISCSNIMSLSILEVII